MGGMPVRRPQQLTVKLLRPSSLLATAHSAHMNPEDLHKLVTTRMPFGKHKGILLADLPGNYLNWFAREGFPKSEMGRLLALMQEIDHNGLRDLLKPLRLSGRSG
jgi:uncharacterized protein (DUF3820 family)